MTDEKPVRKISWAKRIGFLAAVLILLAVFAECGLRGFKHLTRPDASAQAQQNDCEAVVFLCLGDSMAYGLGAERDESFPARLPAHLNRRYSDVPIKVYNLAVPGSNTSEGLFILQKFFKEAENALPDYALILYGINNRWNLHMGSFWKWDESARSEHYFDYLMSRLQLGKVVQLAALNQDAKKQVEAARTADPRKYRQMLNEHGWDMFFKSFADELLAKWVIYDMVEMSRILREHGVEPVFLTYHFEKFPHINDLIRHAAQKADAGLIDLEKPFQFYKSRDMLDKDYFHLNAKGYNELAKRIAEDFSDNCIRFPLIARLRAKEADRRCIARR